MSQEIQAFKQQYQDMAGVPDADIAKALHDIYQEDYGPVEEHLFYDAIDFKPQALPADSESAELTASVDADEQPGLFKRALLNTGETALETGGNLVEFLGRVVEGGEQALTDLTGGFNPGVTWGGDEGLQFSWRVDPEKTDIGLQKLGQQISETSLGYEPHYDWSRFRGEMNPENLAGYILEQGPASMASMAAALFSLPLFVAAQTEGIGETRAENKGLDEPGLKELKEAFVPAVASALLERLGGRKVTKVGGVSSAKDVVKETAKAVGTEAATEFTQENIEYAGETIGTRAPYKFSEGLERGIAGALLGAGVGGGTRLASATTEAAINKYKVRKSMHQLLKEEADKMGVPPPKTQAAPQNEFEGDTNDRSIANVDTGGSLQSGDQSVGGVSADKYSGEPRVSGGQGRDLAGIHESGGRENISLPTDTRIQPDALTGEKVNVSNVESDALAKVELDSKAKAESAEQVKSDAEVSAEGKSSAEAVKPTEKQQSKNQAFGDLKTKKVAELRKLAFDKKISPLPKRKADLIKALVENQQVAKAKVKPKTKEKIAKNDAAVNKIADFGEKIGGARKDIHQGYINKLKDSNVDLVKQSLTKTFPSPEYSRLESSGVSKKTLAFVAAARAEIPRKPNARYPGRVQLWADQVKTLRQFASSVLEDPGKQKIFEERLGKAKGLDGFKNKIDVFEKVDADKLVSANQYSVKKTRVGTSSDKQFDAYILLHNKRPVLREPVIDRGDYDAWLKKAAAYINEQGGGQSTAPRKAPLKVYFDSANKNYVIGYKSKVGLYALKAFSSASGAREHLSKNRPALEAQLESKRKKRQVRRLTNKPRGGPERRGKFPGRNVTPEIFTETFGFRGVEFGNWVEGDKRQLELNESYDALIDLADALNLPTKALSLNGELGLAFGARGKGGKNAAMAHYEPGKVVINLTKKSGPGSLAHEWFHAIDNHLGRRNKENSTVEDWASHFKADRKRRVYNKDSGRYETIPDLLRVELLESFEALHSALGKSDFKKRSHNEDLGRSKPYWSTHIEMGARAFESYIKNRLKEKGIENDYLVNVLDNSEVYPTKQELEQVYTPVYDRIFQTLQHKETEKGVILYSRAFQGEGSSVADVRAMLKLEKGASDLAKKGVIRVVQSIKDLPAELQGKDAVVHDALYHVEKDQIYFVADQLNAENLHQVYMHEMFHRAVAIDKALATHIQKSMANLGEIYWSLKNSNEGKKAFKEAFHQIPSKTPDHVAVQELGAYAVAAYEANVKTLPAKLMKWARDMVAGIKLALARVGVPFNNVTPADLAALARRAIKLNRDQVIDLANETDADIIFSKNAYKNIEQLGKNTETIRGKVVSEISDANAKYREQWLKMLNTRQVVDVGSDVLPEGEAYLTLRDKMLADKNEMLVEAGDLTNDLKVFYRKNRKEADKLSKVAHEATLSGVDPSISGYEPIITKQEKNNIIRKAKERIKVLETKIKGFSNDPSRQRRTFNEIKEQKQLIKEALARFSHEQSRLAAKDHINALWNDLSVEGKQFYKKIKSFYEQRWNKIEQALIEKIERSEVSDAEKSGLIASIRLEFEMNRKSGPYFPLSRFGDYWARLYKINEDGAQETVSVEFFDSPRQQRKFIKKNKGQGLVVDSGKNIQNISNLAPDSKFLSKVNEVLDGHGADGRLIKDEIHQAYLQMLPELSIRKNFIKRKKTPGFNTDMIRALAKQGFHGSYQIARLRYMDQMESTLNNAEGNLKQRHLSAEKSNKATDILNMLKSRHQWLQSPGGSQASAMISSLGFAWYLGATPAAALVNTSQTYAVALPVMGAKFGFGKASRALAKVNAEYFRSKGQYADTLAGERLAAFNEAERAGLFEKTLAHDLAGISEQGHQYSKADEARQYAMNKVAWLFQRAEEYNRHVTMMASYDLAREQGMRHGRALDYAIETTWRTHFDYSNENRATFMQSDVAKVFLMFRQYSANITYFLARNTYLTFKGESKEARSLARRELAGTLGMHAIFAGASGLPVIPFALLGAVLNSVFDEPDEPYDFDTEFRLWLKDYFGKTGGEIIAKGPMSVLTGADIATRTSLDGLWFRENSYEMGGREEVQYWAEQLGGPILGIFSSAGSAYDYYKKGEYRRAFEASVPKAVKDVSKAIRYAEQGATTLKGDVLVGPDEFTPTEIMLQGIGFTPFRLSERYAANRAIKNPEQRLLNRRTSLMNRLQASFRHNDSVMQKETWAEISKFNKKNPQVAITGDTIMRSLKTSNRYRAMALKGIQLNKHLMHLKEKGSFAED